MNQSYLKSTSNDLAQKANALGKKKEIRSFLCKKDTLQNINSMLH